jgi:glycosyltransferase involved in cell wall biosynthesis
MTDSPALRLAILGTRGIPARYGGFETFAEEIAVRLVERGIDVTVYCEAGDTAGPASHRGVRLAYVPAVRWGPLTTILFDLRCLIDARKGFDVVYMLGYGSAPFCFIPRISGSRVWINVDGVEWARAKWGSAAKTYFKGMETLSLWTPNRVIADAAAIRDHLLRRHAGTTTPISVIPYGAPVLTVVPDPALLSPRELAPDRYYLVVCRLEPENHVREIFEGFARSSSARQMAVIGNHETGTAYVKELLQIRDPRIRFLGTIYDQAQLQAIRFHAFAYCHGHSVGGTNPSLLEALGCGNAVLAHENAFNREVARDAALYFEGADSFAAAVARLEGDEPSRTGMRQRARFIVESDYTWDRIADEYLALLRREAGG